MGHPAMKISRETRRRRLFLALVVAGLPCLVLLALAARLMQQERELAASRARQHREQRVLDVAQRLGARLERIRFQAGVGMTPISALELIAFRDGDSLRLPWETGTPAPWPASSAVRSAIASGERAELVERDLKRAIVHYRDAIASARAPADEGYARLLLARALYRGGNATDAMRDYRKIAALGPSVMDDQQIPLGLYALERLRAVEKTSLQPLLENYLDDSIELAPAALHLLATLIDASDPVRRTRVERRIRRVDQAVRLQRDVSRILPRGGEESSEWVAYGDPLWLVGPGKISDRSAVLAISADTIVRTMIAENPSLRGFDLIGVPKGGSQPLGASFPGLHAVLPLQRELPDERLVERREFLVTALAVVLATSLIAAWLLLRDVRREVRLAELRSQFVSSVSHELKTPLAAIRIFAESLRMGRPAESEQRDEYLEIIVNESERLSRLLENVLEFSKIERGERHYKLDWRDLGEVVRAAVRALQYPLQQMGFRLELEIAEDVPPVRLDADAVEQAVLNLLTNAMKYSGTCREIRLRLEHSDGDAILRVIDGGLGIPPNEQEKIFEKFYRAHNSDGISGAGLGLALVAHIAKAHGGRVSVESQPGRGSTFSMFFPLETA
jgi:signal transduction histidine kinase